MVSLLTLLATRYSKLELELRGLTTLKGAKDP